MIDPPAPQGRTLEDYGGVTVLRAPAAGAYPHGNSLLIRGSAETLLVDPSKGLGDLDGVDGVFVSHAHEDHAAGLRRWNAVPVAAHVSDVSAVRDVASMFASFAPHIADLDGYRHTLVTEFELSDRPDAAAVADGHVFDLGGRTVTVVHLPGHTAGHCGLLVEPDGFFYVADIDLTSFGPFYGEPRSSLVDFEWSLQRCRDIDARWYGTFHQKGVIVGVGEFRRRLDAYRSVLAQRDDRLLALVAEPRTLGDIVEHRLVYRAHVAAPQVEMVERLTAQRHIQRLLAAGAVVEDDQGRYRARRS